jgi:uncharacterized protein YgbK (DUF1537 family)
MVIGIVADDLTGAADSVAPFARRGLRAGLGYAIGEGMTYGIGDENALALDTETRSIPVARQTTIVRLTRAATRGLKRGQAGLFYKKMDSTLRGHLRLELDAMRQELPDRLALICPAFPANGRTVEQGLLHIYGVPWTETDFAPTRTFDTARPTVRAAFDAHHEETAAELPLNVLRQGVDATEAALQRMKAEGVRSIFCDAVTQTDLDVLAQVVLRQPDRYLPVGSAGLASAIATHLSLSPSDGGGWPEAKPPDALFRTGAVLVVVGSLHTASRKQAAFLAQKAGIEPIIVQPGALGQARVNALIASRFQSGQRIVLLTTTETPSEHPISLLSVWKSVFWAYRALPQFGLIATGGATAMQILSGLGQVNAGLRITGEIEPGVVCGALGTAPTTLGRNLDGLPLILKAGGFGTEEMLARCVGLA